MCLPALYEGAWAEDIISAKDEKRYFVILENLKVHGLLVIRFTIEFCMIGLIDGLRIFIRFDIH